MERREFFQSLIAGGATICKNRKRVTPRHRQDVQIYHGPMQIPPHVYEAVREDPTPHRATGRGTHLVSRYAEQGGTVWLFRCQIPESRAMVGEIVRTPEGNLRIHCWSAARHGYIYREPAEIVTLHEPTSKPYMPIVSPLMSSDSPTWRREA